MYLFGSLCLFQDGDFCSIFFSYLRFSAEGILEAREKAFINTHFILEISCYHFNIKAFDDVFEFMGSIPPHE